MSKKNKEKVIKKQEDNPSVEEVVEDINEVSEVETLKKQIDDLKNEYARAYADTENLKKRLNAEAEQTRKYRIQSFARSTAVPALYCSRSKERSDICSAAACICRRFLL